MPKHELGVPYAFPPTANGPWDVVVCPVCGLRIQLVQRKDWESFTHQEYVQHYEEQHQEEGK